MKVGDKVRLTKGTETGFIVGQIGNGVFDVDLEDGFVLQLHISEITVIEEAEVDEEEIERNTPATILTEKEPIITEKGLYLSADFKDNRTINLIANNNTKNTYHLFIFNIFKGIKKGISSTIISDNSSFNIRIKKDSNSAPTLAIQFIQFKVDTPPFKVRECVLDLNDKSSFESNIGHTYSINLDPENNTTNVDTDKLKASFFSADNSKENSEIQVTDEIDLHIEKLNEGNREISEENILSIQLSAFQTALENAISSDLDHLTIIHGVGNGILRMEIHKRLANRGDIQWFKDADKQKFGFGATYVQLK